MRYHDQILAPLYESMICELTVSPDQDLVPLHPGNVAVAIEDYSDNQNESEILIAASSGFMVENVDWINIRMQISSGLQKMRIPRVRLNYCLSWYDFNIDHPPPPILV
jgi:hypothetical protein